MSQYDILNSNSVVGEAIVQQSGLFTHFKCTCEMEENALYRIVAEYEDKQIDLGICVRENGLFITQAKIPTKHLGTGSPSFYVRGKEESTLDFAPLLPEVEFLQLRKIDSARFAIKRGVPGLIFNRYDPEVTHPNM